MFATYRSLLSLALLLAAATPAWADELVRPATCKFRAIKETAIGNITLTAGEIRQFRQAHPFATRPPEARPGAKIPSRRATLAELIAILDKPVEASARKLASPIVPKHPVFWCGIVDEWHYAALTARQTCNTLPGSNGNAYFRANPSHTAFNDPNNHHGLFKLDGRQDSEIVLEGSCYVCSTAVSVGTATAIPREQTLVPTPEKKDNDVPPPR